MSEKFIFTYDIDGVILLEIDERFKNGIRPSSEKDVIITGRSFEEEAETRHLLYDTFGIYNNIYFNPLEFDKKTRQSSGEHKARVISELKAKGFHIMAHFEDDPIQILAIKEVHPELNIVYMSHDLTNKENVRRDSWLT